METLPVKPFVIFYDCCVPRSQFHSVLPGVILFADHIFVRGVFPEKVWRNDVLLFDAVEEERRKSHPKQCCVLVTCDGGFREQVRRRQAYGTTVKVVHVSIGLAGSVERNWKAAIELATKFASVYASMRARAFFRRETLEKFREACRRILDEHFPEDETA